jgi:hypothetical protein
MGRLYGPTSRCTMNRREVVSRVCRPRKRLHTEHYGHKSIFNDKMLLRVRKLDVRNTDACYSLCTKGECRLNGLRKDGGIYRALYLPL